MSDHPKRKHAENAAAKQARKVATNFPSDDAPAAPAPAAPEPVAEPEPAEEE